MQNISVLTRLRIDFKMRANDSLTKSLVPPARFQNPNPNPDPWTLTLHLTLTQYSGRYKRFSRRIKFPDFKIYNNLIASLSNYFLDLHFYQPAVFRMINKLDYESLGRPVPLNYPGTVCFPSGYALWFDISLDARMSSATTLWSYSTALYCTVLYCTVLYCTVLYCTVLYCTVLYCTVLYCTVLYSD